MKETVTNNEESTAVKQQPPTIPVGMINQSFTFKGQCESTCMVCPTCP